MKTRKLKVDAADMQNVLNDTSRYRNHKAIDWEIVPLDKCNTNRYCITRKNVISPMIFFNYLEIVYRQIGNKPATKGMLNIYLDDNLVCSIPMIEIQNITLDNTTRVFGWKELVIGSE